MERAQCRSCVGDQYLYAARSCHACSTHCWVRSMHPQPDPRRIRSPGHGCHGWAVYKVWEVKWTFERLVMQWHGMAWHGKGGHLTLLVSTCRWWSRVGR